MKTKAQKSQHVLPLQSETFGMLVKRLKNVKKKADIFEIWLDKMKVKGDLAVIKTYFGVPLMGKTETLDMAKRASKSGLDYVDIPVELQVDEEFRTLAKIKGTKIVRSYHNFEETPSDAKLNEVLAQMQEQGADLLKLATWIKTEEDTDRLLALLDRPDLKNKLIVTGMGELSRRIRIEAPLQGSVFYYAPLDPRESSAPGQLLQSELEAIWASR